MPSKIIGLYFFEDEYKRILTIDSVRYRRIITDFLVPQIRIEKEIWFQQDRASPHTANETIDLLKLIFCSNLYSKKCFIFKAWAYKDKSKIVEKLKNNIEREIDHIGSITLKKVMQGDYERIQNCSQLQGRHLEDDFYHPEKNIL
uniref:Mariner Mos1 transposase n=1 Tax=Strongyloides stercoralis TaxID=6248 RepID=A0A0K0DRZ8_STRER